MIGDRIAAAASDLIGAPFRLHGRDANTGLDCLGLIGLALERVGRECRLPQRYALRNRDIAQPLHFATLNGFIPCTGLWKAGDLLLFTLPGAQNHMAIACDRNVIVHAHAGLGRVVRGPAEGDWSETAHWRCSEE
ncbi:NlpC/P60 family protein [Croceicoccus naphthovorans]|uniref:NlpC/P60 family protein n=1 Tax=Croceicoccus naphthovorans TaxID=1348774 RepID=UPI000AAB0B35|nr:NlpC/P60 family protein [Croceicoccus naphthovorans]